MRQTEYEDIDAAFGENKLNFSALTETSTTQHNVFKGKKGGF